jgi:hypothetical protein
VVQRSFINCPFVILSEAKNLILSPLKGEVRVRVNFPLPLTPSREGREDFFHHLPPEIASVALGDLAVAKTMERGNVPLIT